MNYTIASLEDIQLGQTIDFDKDGNCYIIIIRNNETKETRTKRFENIGIAYEVFQRLTMAVLNGCYSFEQRAQILNGEI